MYKLYMEEQLLVNAFISLNAKKLHPFEVRYV